MKKKIALLLMVSMTMTMLLGGMTGCGDEEEAPVQQDGTEVSDGTSTEGETEANFDLSGIDASKYVTLPEYKGIEVDVEAESYSDDIIEQNLVYIQNQYATTNDITDRPAQVGDVLVIDFTGTMDGELFDGGSSTDETCEIGSGTYFDGFEEGLIGATAGETREVPVNFPDNTEYYGDMAGREAIFTITVKSIGEKVLPELTDEFVLANTGFASLEDLKSDIVAYYEDLVASNNATNSFYAVYNKIKEAAVFENLPIILIEYYEGTILSDIEYYAYNSGTDTETYRSYYGLDDAAITTEAESMAQDYVLCRAIAKAEGKSITEEDILAFAQSYIDDNAYEVTVEEFLAEIDENEIYNHLYSEWLEEFIANNSVINWTNVN